MGERIVILEWEMGSGEGQLVAEGIHDPEAFIDACRPYGVEPQDVARVEHLAYVDTGPRHGCDHWYEPVQGDPTHTVLTP